MSPSLLQAVYGYLQDGGTAAWVVVALTLVAVARVVRLGRRLDRGEAVPLSAWVGPPSLLAMVGGIGGIHGLAQARAALDLGSIDAPVALATIGVVHAHNTPILALTVTGLLCAWSAAKTARVARATAPGRLRWWGPTLPLDVALFGLTLLHGLGLQATLGVALQAMLGRWVTGSSAPEAEPGHRALATTGLLGALGVVAAWAASAFILDQRRLLATGAPLLSFALTAALSCTLAVAFGAVGLAPLLRRGDRGVRRDLVACAGLVIVVIALLVGAAYPGDRLESLLSDGWVDRPVFGL